MSNKVVDDPPAEFELLYPDEPFETMVGPHYFAKRDGRLIAGFRAKPSHANSGGNVHGGALSAFADSALTGFALDEIDTLQFWVATITLNCEYIGRVNVGDWVECHGAVSKLTRSFAFVRGEMNVADRTVLTCSTVLKKVPR
jgi:acyl-coenzyme A thioesterase 13